MNDALLIQIAMWGMFWVIATGCVAKAKNLDVFLWCLGACLFGIFSFLMVCFTKREDM